MKHGRRRLGSDGLLAASPFLLPSVLGLLLFSLLPLVISALISLTNWNGLDELSSAGFFAEHFVGLVDFLELGLVAAGIGVIFLRELAKRALDLFVGCLLYTSPSPRD